MRYRGTKVPGRDDISDALERYAYHGGDRFLFEDMPHDGGGVEGRLIVFRRGLFFFISLRQR